MGCFGLETELVALPFSTYQLELFEWANSLTGSGFPARWNSKNKLMIFTSSSRSLAALENIVHRSGEGLSSVFKTMVIEISDKVKAEEIEIKDLPKNWADFKNYNVCQKIGDQWLENNDSAILKVPSAIVKHEFNYLLNPKHKHFSKVKLVAVEEFCF